MEPFNTRKSAAEYILMADGYDGRAIVDVLNKYLKPGSAVLEIGMGPGKDIELLEENYRVTGSDLSRVFLDMYREKKPGADLLCLDAINLETNRRFDCIYSNKVLHYLSPDDMKQSFARQFEVLNPGGLLCHTLWYGDKEIEVKGMKFYYYTAEKIMASVTGMFNLQLAQNYREMDTDDSLLVILRRNPTRC
jgi:SAM-dependent methyltransferase